MCPTGKSKWGWGSTTACADCGLGQYSDTIGADSCNECPIGTYTLSGANSVCVSCPSNTTTETTGTASASYCKCNLGLIGPPAPLEPRGPPCTPCPAGTDRPLLHAAMCYECEPGKYAAAPGTPFCLDCPVSKYANGYGATACIACAEGFNSVDSTNGCIQCPDNMRSSGVDGHGINGCVCVVGFQPA